MYTLKKSSKTMTGRNFPIHDSGPFSLLLQIPENEDYLTLDEPKTHTQIHDLIMTEFNQDYQELNTLEHPCSSKAYQIITKCSDNSNTTNTTMDSIPHVDSTYNRKRKASFKQNHSEIEKRRRDKMNTYITELSAMIPMCHAMSRKLDKLTVLRMAVQHIKSIRGAVHSYPEGHYKPSFLSDQELKNLILQVADGFLFVVGCDRGRILYVSKSVSKILNYSQGDLLGQSWFDILHPKDVAKVKEQLSSSDLNPRERLIDAKTMLPVKTDVPQGVTRLCPGARRSFFCRMKCKITGHVKEEADTTTGSHRRKKNTSDKRYNVIQCTGYLKSWTPAKIGIDDQEGDYEESCNLSCLVAIGRELPQITVAPPNGHLEGKSNVRPIQFISRHATDGKFLFVDQRVTLVLGFLPQELLGTSMYEYYHHDDIHNLAECHKGALQTLRKVDTNVYRFRSKDGVFIRLQSEWKAFKNPWTKEIEYLIAKNDRIFGDVGTVDSSAMDGLQDNFELFTHVNGQDIHKIINSQVQTSKIGCQIAEQVLDLQRRGGGGESSLGGSPEPTLSGAVSFIPNLPNTNQQFDERNDSRHIISSFDHVRDNYPLSNISNDPVSASSADDEIIEMMEDVVRVSPANGPPTDGNDEAAMAVIMSLLEADAGLGGPVDFSGLPWPLP